MSSNVPSIKKLGRVERKRVTLGAEPVVRVEELSPGQTLPAVVRPTLEGVDLIAWAADNLPFIEETLAAHGAVLFRGFQVGGIDPFRSFIQTVGGHLEQYTYRSTPRTEVGNGVYTSTEYPADKSIPFHNEHSYARSWPMKLFFYCELPAAEGGVTPICDSARVFDRIPEEIREKFRQKRVMYVRNYGDGVDLTWQEVFQTGDRATMEAFCAAEGIEVEWKGGDRVRTRQVCQAVARHPGNGKLLWFNQAHLFHVSSLDPEIREALMEAFADDELPRNTLYGDGTPIEPEALAAIRAAFDAEEVAFPWQKEDVILIDNMAVAHARGPYKGERKIRVGMTQPVDGAGLEA
ncbi:MAG TPA: TauD/TfdA family dioxygenase [Longimicrobium sp.]|nr:TauD/TfdA family dioxygenase [Longimicrobium sp.]